MVKKTKEIDVREAMNIPKSIDELKEVLENVKTMEEDTGGCVDKHMSKCTDAPIILNCGDWYCNDSGVGYFVQKKVGQDVISEKKDICSVPVLIVSNIIADKCYKTELTFKIDGRWVTDIFDNDVLASTSKIIKIANSGIGIRGTEAKRMIDYLYDLQKLNNIPKRVCATTLGWYDTEFVPYSEKLEVLPTDKKLVEIANLLDSEGTLDEWSNFVKDLLCDPAVRINIMTSFASVIVELVGTLPFVVHTWSKTGGGKTVTLMVCASIWGNPKTDKNSFYSAYNDTENYLLNHAGKIKNLPLMINEMQASKHFDLDKLIMRLCEGRERGRLDRDSNAKDTHTYSLAVLSNGEEPILDNNSGGGTSNRVIEINCSDRKIIEDGHRTAEFVKANYGTAGREFIKHLGNVADVYRECLANLEITYPDVTDKQLMTIACIWTADKIASRYIFKTDAVTVDFFKPFLKTEQEVSKPERAWSCLMSIIIEHRRNFDKRCGDSPAVLWGVVYPAKLNVKMNRAVLDRELQSRGFNFKSCVDYWVEKGWMAKQSKRISNSKIISGQRYDVVELFLSAEDMENMKY